MTYITKMKVPAMKATWKRDGILGIIEEDIAFRIAARHCALWHKQLIAYRPYRLGNNRCNICGCKVEV
jgi:hypothetical protein